MKGQKEGGGGGKVRGEREFGGLGEYIVNLVIIINGKKTRNCATRLNYPGEATKGGRGGGQSIE